jgi:aminoglycoside phosphotransferase (APT) family kinase protein
LVDASRMAPTETVTPQMLTHYLRLRFPAAEGIAAKSVMVIPGGRSKRTILIALERAQNLPKEIVMRQDMYLEQRGTTVRDEYGPLKLLSELGLPVPKPVHFEAEASELGPPFLFVERIAGEVPGSYFGMDIACPQVFRDLAAVLARLHRIEPGSAGVFRDTVADPNDRMGGQVEEYWRLWRRDSMWPSPVIESAYYWARNESAATAGTTALVHGDCGPHNLLVRDGGLAGLLDWEFLHIGDPAEDLGIARVYAEAMMPWSEFMDIYRAAGGADIPERRIRLAVLFYYLKGTVLVAASGRNFAAGVTDDFVKGANSYTGLRRIEMKIVEFFDLLAAS